MGGEMNPGNPLTAGVRYHRGNTMAPSYTLPDLRELLTKIEAEIDQRTATPQRAPRKNTQTGAKTASPTRCDAG